MNSQNPYLLTLPQLISAKKKISQVAAFYDPNRYSLAGFNSVALDATEFREQLRRNFNINLTDSELGAIVFLFDQDGDGKVDSIEFINEFLKLGNEEKNRIRFTREKAQERIAKLKADVEVEREKKAQMLTSVKVATKWTQEDETAAIKKIAKIAFTYDNLKGGLEGFLQCDSLKPQEFQEQIRRVFSVKLTPEETAALTNIFDKYQLGEVDCKEFVYQFFRIRRNEIDSHAAAQAEKTRKKNIIEKQRQDEMHEKFCRMAMAEMTEATEEETQSALEKIRIAAAFYKPSLFVNAIQKAFESEELTPTAFKEMLKNNFDVRLSSGELHAVVKLFDLNCDGMISCVEFTSTFFKIGFNERSRQVENKRYRDERQRRVVEMKEEKMAQDLLARVRTRVIYPVLPSFDDVFAMTTLGVLPPTNQAQTANHGQKTPFLTAVDEKAGSDDNLSGAFSMSSNILPIDNSDNGSVGSKSSLNSKNSASRSLSTQALPVGSYGGRARKQSTIEILSPDKFAAKLASTKTSLSDLYPRASQITKDFIKELEAEERRITALRRVPKKTLPHSTRASTAQSEMSDSVSGFGQSFSSMNSTGGESQGSVSSGDDPRASNLSPTSANNMTANRARRRPSRKVSMTINTNPALLPFLSPSCTPSHMSPNGSNRAIRQALAAVNQMDANGEQTYNTDDFGFNDGQYSNSESPQPFSQARSANETPIVEPVDADVYVEVEATLPPIDFDFDRPRTVHSNVRPPSREAGDGSGRNSGRRVSSGSGTSETTLPAINL